MVRNYVRKSNRCSYTKETFQEALAEIKAGSINAYKASKKYKIPLNTIMDHLKGKHGILSKTLGRRTAISHENEKLLAGCLLMMEKNGFGLSKKEVLEVVREFIKANKLKTPFKDDLPGEDWFLGFKKRHNLTFKKPQGVESCNDFTIDECFPLLENTIIDLGLQNIPCKTEIVGEEKIRKKWKYLRDQYSAEVARIAERSRKDATGNLQQQSSRWIYFKSLNFLKDVIKPRLTNDNVKGTEKNEDQEESQSSDICSENVDSRYNENNQDSIKEEYHTLDYNDEDDLEETTTVWAEVPIEQPDPLPIPNNFPPDPLPIPNTYQQMDQNSGNSPQVQKRHSQVNQKKRMRMDDSSTNLEENKMDTYETKASDSEDEDLMFFKSVVPHIKKIRPEKMLAFRSKILDLVQDYAYSNSNVQVYSHISHTTAENDSAGTSSFSGSFN